MVSSILEWRNRCYYKNTSWGILWWWLSSWQYQCHYLVYDVVLHISRCNYWGKLSNGSMTIFFFFFFNCMWISNYFYAKKFNLTFGGICLFLLFIYWFCIFFNFYFRLRNYICRFVTYVYCITGLGYEWSRHPGTEHCTQIDSFSTLVLLPPFLF